MQCTCTIYLYLLPRCPKNFRHWISKIGLMIFSYKPASCFHEALGQTFFLGLEINCLNEANPFADPLWSASTGLALCSSCLWNRCSPENDQDNGNVVNFPVVSPLNQFVNMSQKHIYTHFTGNMQQSWRYLVSTEPNRTVPQVAWQHNSEKKTAWLDSTKFL